MTITLLGRDPVAKKIAALTFGYSTNAAANHFVTMQGRYDPTGKLEYTPVIGSIQSYLAHSHLPLVRLTRELLEVGLSVYHIRSVLKVLDLPRVRDGQFSAISLHEGAYFTGRRGCIPFADETLSEDWSMTTPFLMVTANTMERDGVTQAIVDRWNAYSGEPLQLRMLRAAEAGIDQDCRGDKKDHSMALTTIDGSGRVRIRWVNDAPDGNVREVFDRTKECDLRDAPPWSDAYKPLHLVEALIDNGHLDAASEKIYNLYERLHPDDRIMGPLKCNELRIVLSKGENGARLKKELHERYGGWGTFMERWGVDRLTSRLKPSAGQEVSQQHFLWSLHTPPGRQSPMPLSRRPGDVPCRQWGPPWTSPKQLAELMQSHRALQEVDSSFRQTRQIGLGLRKRARTWSPEDEHSLNAVVHLTRTYRDQIAQQRALRLNTLLSNSAVCEQLGIDPAVTTVESFAEGRLEFVGLRLLELECDGVFPLQHIYDEVTKEFGLRSTSQGPQIEL